jgi:hypothetical protein
MRLHFDGGGRPHDRSNKNGAIGPEIQVTDVDPASTFSLAVLGLQGKGFRRDSKIQWMNINSDWMTILQQWKS